jgi:RND superfamily putative drug exporter
MRFARLGQFLVDRRRIVLVVGLLAFVTAGALGADVASKLSTGGFEDPSADSTKAAEILDEQFHAGEPNVVLLIGADSGNVDDAVTSAVGQRITDELGATERVGDVVSYWSLDRPPPLRADDSSSALVLARVDGTEDEIRDTVDQIRERFTVDDEHVEVGVSGREAVFAEMGDTIEDDLARAELIALPITLVLLILVFRSVIAALLPIAVGGLAIIGTFFVLDAVASFTTVSIFALNLTTAMGLGLAIDYSLFVISRYREERELGNESRTAIVRTVATAGRAVFFSGFTVAVSLSALLVFPIAFLRSFAYAGIPVVALAVFGAVVLLPAGLAVLGDRINAISLPQRSRLVLEGTFWWRIANAVMRRPWPVTIGVVLFLLVLGLPFLRVNFGLPDDRVLATEAEVRQVNDEIREHYGSDESGAASVVLPGADLERDRPSIDAYASDVSTLEGVARVDSPTGIYIGGQRVTPDPPLAERFVPELPADDGVVTGTWLSVVPSVEPVSSEGEQLVAAIRDLPAPAGDEVLVGGTSAVLVDEKVGTADRLPLALAIIVVATFVLLFLMFGSLLVPAKALVVNTLSLTATFGAMVWIFQEGNLSGILDFTATGMLDTTTPVLMFCVAFGLSMDYEVFLLSRIKEEYDKTGDNTKSVATGLARTGRIVTAAALLISVVFLSFAASSVSFIKLFGVGLTLAVLMDATIVRATLVPAFMRLAGRANWWAPAPLKRVYERIGLSEGRAEEALLDLRAPIPPSNGDRAPKEPVTPERIGGSGGST